MIWQKIIDFFFFEKIALLYYVYFFHSLTFLEFIHPRNVDCYVVLHFWQFEFRPDSLEKQYIFLKFVVCIVNK